MGDPAEPGIVAPRLLAGNAAPAPPTAYDRIAALSAVTSPPPHMADEPVTTLDLISGWADIVLAYLQQFWRQVGLIVAMVFAAGLLFWRLGERSRHEEQELFLDEGIEAGPEEFEAALEEADVPLAEPVVLAEAHMAHEAAPDIEAPAQSSPARPAFPTLHAALAAMKAERLGSSSGRASAVEA